ncbi:MAG: EamA family transporter [Candidatus Omnitrophota bacterium]
MNAFLWAILAACIWGVVPLLEKVGLNKIDAITGLFYRCFGVVIGLLFLGVFILSPQQIKSVDVKSAALLVLAGFLASFVAQIAFYHGLKLGEISRVVPVSGIYPVFAFIFGILILGEGISLLKCLGIILAVLGVWLLKIG